MGTALRPAPCPRPQQQGKQCPPLDLNDSVMDAPNFFYVQERRLGVRCVSHSIFGKTEVLMGERVETATLLYRARPSSTYARSGRRPSIRSAIQSYPEVDIHDGNHPIPGRMLGLHTPGADELSVTFEGLGCGEEAGTRWDREGGTERERE